jgi:glycosyltransferase involved in cell wall biosynthesis
MKPLVSIALCTYNGSRYLAAQLESLCGQTYRQVEVILVDDGSTDNTISIAGSFKERLDIKLYCNEQNLGFIKNFEKAVSLCTGEYIALCDQDDIWVPEKIETLMKLVQDCILVYSDSELVDEHGKSLHKRVSDVVNPIRESKPLPLLFNNCAPGNTLLFKKELLKYALPFPSTIFHDWWLMYTAATIGKIAYSDKPLVQYRQHTGNITNMDHHRKERARDSKQTRLERTIHNLEEFQTLNQRAGVKNTLLEKALYLYKNKNKLTFDLTLFLFLMKHKRDFYFILKKSNFKKNHRIFKECLR